MRNLCQRLTWQVQCLGAMVAAGAPDPGPSGAAMSCASPRPLGASSHACGRSGPATSSAGHMHTDNGSDLVQYTLYQSHAIPCVWVNTMEAYTLQQWQWRCNSCPHLPTRWQWCMLVCRRCSISWWGASSPGAAVSSMSLQGSRSPWEAPMSLDNVPPCWDCDDCRPALLSAPTGSGCCWLAANTCEAVRGAQSLRLSSRCCNDPPLPCWASACECTTPHWDGCCWVARSSESCTVLQLAASASCNCSSCSCVGAKGAAWRLSNGCASLLGWLAWYFSISWSMHSRTSRGMKVWFQLRRFGGVTAGAAAASGFRNADSVVWPGSVLVSRKPDRRMPCEHTMNVLLKTAHYTQACVHSIHTYGLRRHFNIHQRSCTGKWAQCESTTSLSVIAGRLFAAKNTTQAAWINNEAVVHTQC